MGKLNLLHHKSWHVYSKDNREKVRKDEEAAEKIEKGKQDRIEKAEQERRIEQLRSSRRDRGALIDEKDESANQNQHINLFHDLEKIAGSVVLVNDKAEEQKKWEDKHTMYLGETKDGKKDAPWYNGESSRGILPRSLADATTATADEIDEKKRKRKERHEEKRKKREDPMEALKQFMESRKASAAPPSSHHVSKRSSGPSSSKTIEQLRQERLERELAERNRTQQAVNPSLGNVAATHHSSKRFYNSQFNPNLMRKEDDRD